MNSNSKFDYVIIGCGVAGLHLAYQFSQKNFFSTKKIALIDKVISPLNDRILSFWEQGEGNWNHIIYKSWDKAFFNSNFCDLEIDLDSYSYKSLCFKAFSEYSRKKISENLNITFIEEEVTSIEENIDSAIVKFPESEISAQYVFDSRLSESYLNTKDQFPSVIQSFKGWVIVFEESVFDQESFTMMDYRYQFNDSNSFMYILPSSGKEALLEYTFFTPYTISDQKFDEQIKGYIEKFFPNVSYNIQSMESGEIPMTTYPFINDNSRRVLKIGTAGGWVKASTGYSFKFAEKNAVIISEQLEKSNVVLGYRKPRRFRFYDRLFIKVLQNQNSKGSRIFSEMYKKVKPTILFRFLDEETTLMQEIGIILKLPYWPFIKALFYK